MTELDSKGGFPLEGRGRPVQAAVFRGFREISRQSWALIAEESLPAGAEALLLNAQLYNPSS